MTLRLTPNGSANFCSDGNPCPMESVPMKIAFSNSWTTRSDRRGRSMRLKSSRCCSLIISRELHNLSYSLHCRRNQGCCQSSVHTWKRLSGGSSPRHNARDCHNDSCPDTHLALGMNRSPLQIDSLLDNCQA